MILFLKIAGAALLMIAIYMDVVAWRVLRQDQTLSNVQKYLQLMFVLFVPFVGASVALRLCELANPGTVQIRAIPWPFRAIVVDQPIPQNPDAETFEEHKKRMFNV